MLKKVAEILRLDEFTATAAIFPDINRERISNDLDLKQKGETRGTENLPDPDSKSLDHIEMSAISRVEELRRRGLETFESHRKIYSERLGRATSARMAVEQGARDAIASFMQIVIQYQAMMVTPQEELQEAYAYRNHFREANKLGKRPAAKSLGWSKVFAIGLVMVIIESILNGYLFSQSNPMGLAGGVVAAVLVSAANVSISTFLGMGGKYVNVVSRRFFTKAAGLLLCLLWVGFAVVYNLGVAHFRDAVEDIGDWREASISAVSTMIQDPIGLSNIESWLLLLIGFFISTISFVKGIMASDTYPGYSRVSKAVHEARDGYIDHLEEAIQELEEHRDTTVQELMETSDQVQRHINDSVDALHGQSYLIASADQFLEQCNISANYCLSIYRDANKAVRKTPPPDYFSKEYAYKAVDLKPIETKKKEEAESQIMEINSLISKAIQDIYDAYNDAVDAHRNIDELQGTSFSKPIKKAAPPAPRDLKVIKPDSTSEGGTDMILTGDAQS